MVIEVIYGVVITTTRRRFVRKIDFPLSLIVYGYYLFFGGAGA